MQRADYATLIEMGFDDTEIQQLGLWEPAKGEPAQLAEAYIRRSAKNEDLVTLRLHLRNVVTLAERLNVQIRHVWFEQFSASKRYVTRKQFDKALACIIDGKSKAFLVWKLDRFDRRGMGVVGTMMDDFANRKARLVTYIDGIDSSQKGSRTIIAILSERAREEAEDIALRVKNGHDAHKDVGRRGTGVPPFGTYSAPKSGKVEPHPTEYPIARELADLLLAGDATRVVAEKLNAKGYRTRNGSTWSATAVGKLSQSPLFAGMVPDRERAVDEHGNPLGTWKGYGEPRYNAAGEAIRCGTGVITPAEWFRIKAIIADRTNPFAGRGKPSAKYLLTRILRCGRCKGHMNGGGGKYHCSARQQRGKEVCQGIHTMADRVEGAVISAWIGSVSAMEPDDDALIEIGRRWLRFSDPESQARKEHAADALRSAEARLERLDDAYYNPTGAAMSESRYTRQAEALAATIETLTASLQAVDRATDLTPLRSPEHLRAAWEGADFPMKRVLLSCLFRHVTILPATGRGDVRPIEERLRYNDGE